MDGRRQGSGGCGDDHDPTTWSAQGQWRGSWSIRRRPLRVRQAGTCSIRNRSALGSAGARSPSRASSRSHAVRSAAMATTCSQAWLIAYSLRYPPHAQQRVAAGAEHQLLQIPGLGQVPCLRRREDALRQTPYVVLDLLPIDGQPVGDLVLRSVRRGDGRRGGLRRVCRLRCRGVQLVLWFRCRRALSLHRLTWPRQHPLGSGHRPYPAGYTGPTAEWPATNLALSRCLSATGIRFLAILFPPRVRPPSQSAHRPAALPDLDGVPTFHTSEKRPGWAPPIPRGRWCPPC